jgi:hypothetical protein
MTQDGQPTDEEDFEIWAAQNSRGFLVELWGYPELSSAESLPITQVYSDVLKAELGSTDEVCFALNPIQDNSLKQNSACRFLRLAVPAVRWLDPRHRINDHRRTCRRNEPAALVPFL